MVFHTLNYTYFLILFLIIFAWTKDIQIVNGYEYSPPKGLTFLTSFPSDLQEYSKLTFQKEKINEWLAISALTGIMIAYDEPLIVEAKKIGAKLKKQENDICLDLAVVEIWVWTKYRTQI